MRFHVSTSCIKLALTAFCSFAIAESGPSANNNPRANPQSTRGLAQIAAGLPADYQGAEVAVILNRSQFTPSVIRLRPGLRTRLVFATVNPKPGALVVEGFNLQRWVPNQEPSTQRSPERLEIEREVSAERVTEVIFDPVVGTFPFHDALSGARGEIIVE